MRNYAIMVLAGIIFLALFITGLFLASHKPLWGDELVGQVNISKNSYAAIFSFKIDEGNVSPLFYSSQKLICDLGGYKLPWQWSWENPNLNYDYRDSFSQVFLRINPVFFMSLAIALIFYFFSRSYSFCGGAYSLIVSLSTYMVWAYWAETRVYALWFFLTTAQALLFLFIVQQRSKGGWAWKSLIVAHSLLAMSIVFSIAQIAIVSFLLWIFLERNWKRYIALTMLPSLLCMVYYVHSPRWNFIFDIAPFNLVRSSFPNERILVVMVFAALLALYFIQRKFGFPPVFKNDYLTKGAPVFFLTILMLSSGFFLLLMFKVLEKKGLPAFTISNRYFIYLAPISIISITLFSIVLFRAFQKRPLIQAALISFLGGLFVLRIHSLQKIVLSMLSR